MKSVSTRVKLLTAGGLSLCTEVKEGPAVPFEESYAPDTAWKEEWYLLEEGTGQKVRVTRNNYIAVLELLISDQPDLIRKLGEKGYRFQDLHSIIEEYNRLT